MSHATRNPIGDRGLVEYLARTDTNGEPFRVQSSSSAEESKVCIFTEQATGAHLGHPIPAALHLNADDAHEIIAALTMWLQDVGEEC